MSTRLPRLAAALQFLATLCLIVGPLFLLFLVAMLVLPGDVDVTVGDGAYTIPGDRVWTTWTNWVGIFVFYIPILFGLMAIFRMRQLFRLYRLGDPLASNTGPLIRSIGFYLMLSAVLGILVKPIGLVLLSLSSPPGEGAITVSLTTSDVGFILVSGLLMMIGWSMSEASRIAAENREFV